MDKRELYQKLPLDYCEAIRNGPEGLEKRTPSGGRTIGRKLVAGWGADAETLGSPFERSSGETVERSFFGFGTGGTTGGAGAEAAGQGIHLRTLALGGASQMTRPFLQHPWLNACVNAWARAVVQARPVLYESDDPEAPEVTKGPLFDLLKRPARRKSTKDFLRLWTMHLGECGESILFLHGKNGIKIGGEEDADIPLPNELRAECGSVVNLEIDEEAGIPLFWELANRTNAETEFRYEPGGVVQIAMWGPYDYWRGTGPTQACLRRATIDFKADRLDEALIENGGTPAFALSTGEAVNDPLVKKLREQYRQHNGAPEKNRAPLILPKGLEPKKLGLTPAEMEAQVLRIWNRNVIMAAFGVTAPILGITDDVNRANAEVARREFWEGTVTYLLELFSDQFTTGLIRRLGTAEREYRLGWDLTGVAALRESQDGIVERVDKIYRTGAPTFEEAAKIGGAEWDEIQEKEQRFAAESKQSQREPEDVRPKPGENSDEADEDADRSIPPTVVRRAIDALDEPGARAEYALRFDDALVPFDKKLAAVTSTVFRKWFAQVHRGLADLAAEGSSQRSAVGTVVRSAESDAALLDALLAENAAAWELELAEITAAPLETVYLSGAQAIAAEVGLPVFINATNPAMLSYLQASTVQLAEQTFGTLREEVRDTILRTLADGKERGTLAARIRETLVEQKKQVRVLEDKLGTRAERIARTETTRIANHAKAAELQAQGFDRMRWVALPGGNTRADHADLDGKIQTIGEVFGHNLRWPGDENAAAKQVVNCRCTVGPVANRKPEVEP